MEEIGWNDWKDDEWIHLAQCRIQWRRFVGTAMDFSVTCKARNVLSS
jgi:hypothetical protein